MQLVWNWWFRYCHLQGNKCTRQQKHVNRRPYQAGSSAKFLKVPGQVLPNAQLCCADVTLKPQNNEQTQRKSQLQLKTNTHLFPSHFQLKIFKQQQQGTWCSVWTYFPRKWVGSKKCVFQEGVMLFIWKFWQNRDCCAYN